MIQSVFIKTYVNCVKFLNENYLLASAGNVLQIYNINNTKLINNLAIFTSQRIHGLVLKNRVATEEGHEGSFRGDKKDDTIVKNNLNKTNKDGLKIITESQEDILVKEASEINFGNNNTVNNKDSLENTYDLLIYGGLEIALVQITLNNSYNISVIIIEIWTTHSWIQDVSFFDNNRYAVLGSSNVIYLFNQIYDNNLQKYKIKLEKCEHCQEKSILYSGKILGTNWSNIIILCGTVFSQITIWSPVINDCNIIHRLIGHQGVIFSVSFHEENRNIVSTSDDRTIRVWNVQIGKEKIDEFGKNKSRENKNIDTETSSIERILDGINEDEKKTIETVDNYKIKGEDDGELLKNREENVSEIVGEQCNKLVENINHNVYNTKTHNDIFNIAEANEHSINDLVLNHWINAKINLKYTIFGHTARIWKNIQLNNDKILSIGEDGQLKVWFNDQLIYSWNTHQNGNIWSIDYSEQLKLIVTGGGDCGVNMWPFIDNNNFLTCKKININFEDIEIRIRSEHEVENDSRNKKIQKTYFEESPRINIEYDRNAQYFTINSGSNNKNRSSTDFPRQIIVTKSRKLILISNNGTFLSYENNAYKIILHNNQFKSYCLLGLSKNKNYISAASIHGDILIFDESTEQIICNVNIGSEKIYSLHWLNDEDFVICTSNGKLTICKFIHEKKLTSSDFSSLGKSNEIRSKIDNVSVTKSNETKVNRHSPDLDSDKLISEHSLNKPFQSSNIIKINSFLLPPCKERWLTSALLKSHLFICGDRDGSIHIYKVLTNSLLKTYYKIHSRLGVSCIEHINDQLISIGRDGFIRYWEITNESIVENEGELNVRFPNRNENNEHVNHEENDGQHNGDVEEYINQNSQLEGKTIIVYPKEISKEINANSLNIKEDLHQTSDLQVDVESIVCNEKNKTKKLVENFDNVTKLNNPNLPNSINLYHISSNKLPIEWPVSILFTNHDIYILGFNETHFIIWSINEQKNILKLNCGGGHRSWDCLLDEHMFYFSYIKQKSVYSINIDLNDIVRPGIVQSFHRDEINVLKIIKFGYDRLIVSGGEDNTIRISKLMRINKSETNESLKRENDFSEQLNTSNSKINKNDNFNNNSLQVNVTNIISSTNNVFDTRDFAIASQLLEKNSSDQQKSNDSLNRTCSNMKNVTNSYSLDTLLILRSHISSVRCLNHIKINNDIYIVSGGGRAQLKIWKIKHNTENRFDSDKASKIQCRELYSHMLNGIDKKEKSWKLHIPRVNPETRYMDICLYVFNNNEDISSFISDNKMAAATDNVNKTSDFKNNMTNHDSVNNNDRNYKIGTDNNLYIVTACSDGFIRIFSYDTKNNIFYFLKEISFHKKCVLKVFIKKYNNLILLFSMATDGTLAIWDFENLINNSSENNNGNTSSISENLFPESSSNLVAIRDFSPLITFNYHKSGINSFDCKIINNNLYIITGGDDCSLILLLLNCNLQLINKIIQFRAHGSQITGVMLLNNNYLISCSVDEKFILWKYSEENFHVQSKHICCIPDIHGVEMIDECFMFVYGCGLEIVNVKLDGKDE